MNEVLNNSIELFIKGSEKNLSSGTISSIVITGMVVVFIGLILLIISVSIYGKIFSTVEAKKENKNKKEISTKKIDKSLSMPAPIVEDGIEEEIVAVITAAISAMGATSGKKLVIRSVKNAKPARNVWASAGIADNTRPF